MEYLNQFLRKPSHEDVADRLDIVSRLDRARKVFAEVESPAGLEKLSGTPGAEPIEAYCGSRD